jgi:hypothetical protein
LRAAGAFSPPASPDVAAWVAATSKRYSPSGAKYCSTTRGEPYPRWVQREFITRPRPRRDQPLPEPPPFHRHRFISPPTRQRDCPSLDATCHLSASSPSRLAIFAAASVLAGIADRGRRRESRLDCIARCAPSRSYRPPSPTDLHLIPLPELFMAERRSLPKACGGRL